MQSVLAAARTGVDRTGLGLNAVVGRTDGANAAVWTGGTKAVLVSAGGGTEGVAWCRHPSGLVGWRRRKASPVPSHSNADANVSGANSGAGPRKDPAPMSRTSSPEDLLGRGSVHGRIVSFVESPLGAAASSITGNPSAVATAACRWSIVRNDNSCGSVTRYNAVARCQTSAPRR